MVIGSSGQTVASLALSSIPIVAQSPSNDSYLVVHVVNNSPFSDPLLPHLVYQLLIIPLVLVILQYSNCQSFRLLIVTFLCRFRKKSNVTLFHYGTWLNIGTMQNMTPPGYCQYFRYFEMLHKRQKRII